MEATPRAGPHPLSPSPIALPSPGRGGTPSQRQNRSRIGVLGGGAPSPGRGVSDGRGGRGVRPGGGRHRARSRYRVSRIAASTASHGDPHEPSRTPHPPAAHRRHRQGWRRQDHGGGPAGARAVAGRPPHPGRGGRSPREPPPDVQLAPFGRQHRNGRLPALGPEPQAQAGVGRGRPRAPQAGASRPSGAGQHHLPALHRGRARAQGDRRPRPRLPAPQRPGRKGRAGAGHGRARRPRHRPRRRSPGGAAPGDGRHPPRTLLRDGRRSGLPGVGPGAVRYRRGDPGGGDAGPGSHRAAPGAAGESQARPRAADRQRPVSAGASQSRPEAGQRLRLPLAAPPQAQRGRDGPPDLRMGRAAGGPAAPRHEPRTGPDQGAPYLPGAGRETWS